MTRRFFPFLRRHFQRGGRAKRLFSERSLGAGLFSAGLFRDGFHGRSVAPQAFQSVLVPNVLPHDMDNDVEKIQHLPGRAKVAFHRPGTDIVVVPEFVA